MLADGDGEADVHLAADGDHGVGVEAAVGADGELSRGSGVAHPAHRLPQEVVRAPAVLARPAQPHHQHVAGVRGDGQQRVIAPLAGVTMAAGRSLAGALLARSVGLADGGVQVDGRRRPAPAAQARASSSRLTRSSWRT